MSVTWQDWKQADGLNQAILEQLPRLAALMADYPELVDGPGEVEALGSVARVLTMRVAAIKQRLREAGLCGPNAAGGCCQ